jgi:hypothetical protein
MIRGPVPKVSGLAVLCTGAAASQRIQTTKVARLSRRPKANCVQRSVIGRLHNQLMSDRIFRCRRITRN